MGRTATIIAVSYTVACAFAIVFMLYVAVSTRSRRRADQEELRTLAGREKTWFAIVIVLLAALLFDVAPRAAPCRRFRAPGHAGTRGQGSGLGA